MKLPSRLEVASLGAIIAVALGGAYVAAQPISQPGGGPSSGNATISGGNCATHSFTNGIATNGTPVCAQPAASDLSDGGTGTGAVAHAAGATLSTPTLGVATLTTVAGKNAITSITPNTTTLGSGGSYSAPACAASHVCDSLSGEIVFTTGTAPSGTAALFTVTFADTRTNIPNCVVQLYSTADVVAANNSKAGQVTTTSTLAPSAASVLNSNAAFTLDYLCGGD